MPGGTTEAFDKAAGVSNAHDSIAVGYEAVDSGATGTRTITNDDSLGHGGDQTAAFAVVISPKGVATHEASASGAGAGTGAASAAATRLASVSGTGTGAGATSAEAARVASASGIGVGTGNAVASRECFAAAAGSGLGSGTASATVLKKDGDDTSRWFEDLFASEAFKFWWTVGADASLVGGRARLACTSAYDGFLVSDPITRLRGSTWTVEAPVLADTSAPGTETFFQVQIDEENELRIWVSGGLIRFREEVAGVGDSEDEAYDPEAHLCWQIRIDEDGTVFWETSPDGEAWTIRWEKVSAIALDETAHIRLRTGDFEGDELEPAYTEFDNIAVDVVWEDFRADAAEGDFSDLLHVQAPEGRATVVDGFYRFELQPGDIEPETGNQRAEAISGRKYVAGDERYILDVIRVDAWDYGVWGLLGQEREEGGINPPVCLQIEPVTGKLLVSHGNGEDIYWEGPPVVLGEQFKIVRRVLYHPTEGEVDVWFNGVKQVMVKGTGLTTVGSAYSYDKFGIYRDPEATESAIVYFDEHRVTKEFPTDPPVLEHGLYVRSGGKWVLV